MVCPTTPQCPCAIIGCDESLSTDQVVPAVGRLPKNSLALIDEQQELGANPRLIYRIRLQHEESYVIMGTRNLLFLVSVHHHPVGPSVRRVVVVIESRDLDCKKIL